MNKENYGRKMGSVDSILRKAALEIKDVVIEELERVAGLKFPETEFGIISPNTPPDRIYKGGVELRNGILLSNWNSDASIHIRRPVVLLPEGIYHFQTDWFLDSKGVTTKAMDYSTKIENLEDYIVYGRKAVNELNQI